MRDTDDTSLLGTLSPAISVTEESSVSGEINGWGERPRSVEIKEAFFTSFPGA